MAATKTRSEAAILVLVVFLLGFILGGIADHFWGQHVWRAHEAHRLEKLTREVQLTPDQQKQITAIIDETNAQIHNLNEQMTPQKDRIKQESRERMREVLTPEQKPKFDDFLRRLDEEHRK